MTALQPLAQKSIIPADTFFMLKPVLLLTALCIFTGTTYVIKEGGVEVGRYEENDGKSGTEIIENDAGSREVSAKAVAGPSQAPQKSKQTYDWYYNARGLEAGLKHLKKTGEPIFVYFHAAWCPVCKKYDAKVFADSKVRNYLLPFVKVRIDEAKERGLIKKYKVEGYPTFLVLSKQGQNKLELYSNPETFIKQLKKAGLV